MFKRTPRLVHRAAEASAWTLTRSSPPRGEPATHPMPRIHWTRRSSHTPEEENIDAAKFTELADGAKTNCPVSKVLAAAEITLDAKLV